jgi:hypothetical protein
VLITESKKTACRNKTSCHRCVYFEILINISFTTMANFSRTSRAAQGKKLKFFNNLCDTFGFGIPIFTYFEKTPYSTPFQIGVAVEELGISGNTKFSIQFV